MQVRIAMAAMIIAFASAAHAAKLGPDVVVRYDDLDLSTARGAKTLSERIRLAAESVCAPLDQGNLSSIERRKACVKLLVSDALTRIGERKPALAVAPQSLR